MLTLINFNSQSLSFFPHHLIPEKQNTLESAGIEPGAFCSSSDCCTMAPRAKTALEAREKRCAVNI